MKKSILSVIFILSLISVKSQINLVGAATSQGGGIDILKWEALDSESVETYPSILTGYYLGSSAFNSYNSNYYLTGLTSTSQGLFTFNTQTNSQSLSLFSNFTNISEFDMSTGKLYDLRMDSTDYFSVSEFNIGTGTDSLLGVIHEPGADGLVADAIGFDANNGILYYVGFTYEPALYLYAIPVRDETFSYTRTQLIVDSPGNNISSLNYDNVNDKLYALNSTWDSFGNFTGNEVVEIDFITGEVITRAELSEFIGFVASSSSFDQNTGSFLLVGIDTNYLGSMIVFDTYTNTYVTGFVPGNVSEIACDNAIFALNNYILTAIEEEPGIEFSLYPNPATDKIIISNLSGFKGNLQVSLFNQNGELVLRRDFNDNNDIILSLKEFASGTYLLRLASENTVRTKKIIIN